MTKAQITVRGAGILGLSCAYVMACRGARVRLVDPYGIGAGASGGVVGALAPHVPELWNVKKDFQLDALLAASAFWQGVEADSGLPSGYARYGRVQIVPEERLLELAHQRVAQAKTLWRGQASCAVLPCRGDGWEPASPTGFLFYDDLSARLHPRRALAALARAFQNRGGQIVLAEADDQGLVLHAGGVAGLHELGHSMGYPVGTGEKGQALTLRFDARNQPQIFVDGVHIVPHEDGTVAIGSTAERHWQDAYATDHLLEALHQKALAVLPCLQGAEVMERWAALRPRSVTRAPIMGPWPQRAGHFVLNGGFKIAFGLAHRLADIMADLMLKGQDNIPAGFHVTDCRPR